MTLLSICRDAIQYVGQTAPSYIVGNNQQTAILALAAANMAGESIARRPEGGWTSMIREYDFWTQASTTTYAGTLTNISGQNKCALVIPVDGADTFLAALDRNWIASGTGLPKNSVVMTSIPLTTLGVVVSYTLTINQPASSDGDGNYSFGRSDYPLPSDLERIIDGTFWDRTRYWAMRGPQSPQQWQLYKSSAIGYASVQRRYRFRNTRDVQNADNSTGLSPIIGISPVISIDPVPMDNGAALVFEYVSNGWCQNSAGTVFQNSWAADNDTGVIDEYLIKLETIWRLCRRLGLSYSDEMAEAERQIDKAVAIDGAAPVLNMTPNNNLSLIGPWNLPETGYGQGGYGGFIIGVSEIGGPGLG